MASTKSRYINGQLCFYSGHRKSIVHVVGDGDVSWKLEASHLQDAGVTGTDPAGYITTVVEAGSGTSEVTAAVAADHVAVMTAAANEDDGVQIQLNGEAFTLASDHDVYFGIKLQGDDVDQTDILVGLCISDTTVLGGMTDGVYFESVDGSASISTVSEKDSTETQSDSEGTLADDTGKTLEFYWDGSESSVEFFIDGVSVGTSTTNVPTDELLTPTIAMLTGEAVANTVTIHWARAYCIGRS